MWNSQPTGSESLVEKWIFHKLNIAATEINTQLAERNFMAATNAAHNFWLYELCDVYIVSFASCSSGLVEIVANIDKNFQEAMKPMSDESAPAATRKSAQQTLYTCLDHGLRLLHPFMPFVTEELWQRLPRRPNDPTPSIMVSSFPINVRRSFLSARARACVIVLLLFEKAFNFFDICLSLAWLMLIPSWNL